METSKKIQPENKQKEQKSEKKITFYLMHFPDGTQGLMLPLSKDLDDIEIVHTYPQGRPSDEE